MGLIRFLILALIIWIGYFLIRNWLQKRKQQRTNHAVPSEDMAKCSHCQTYVPKEKAIREGELWFCSKEHLLKYQESQNDS